MKSILIALCLLLSCAVSGCSGTAPGDSATPTTGAPPTPEGRGLVLGAADSPVLDALAERLELTRHDGGQKLADYDLLILDGDAHAADTFREHTLVQEALRTGKWLLALDVNREEKRDGLGGLVHAASGGKSPAYAVRVAQDARGRHEVQVVEFARDPLIRGQVQDGLETISAAHRQGGMDAKRAGVFADALFEKVHAPMLRTAQVPDDIPADLIYATFYYTQVVPWTVGNAGRKNGSQDTGYQANYTFTVFLNNKDNPQGDFQYVLADVDLTANPTRGSGNFLNMKARSGTDWAVKTYDEMAWFQDRVIVQVEPYEDPAYPYTEGWISVATSPETVNNQTSVTSAVNFSIGYTQGQGATGTFGYSKAQTRTITDWKMTNESSGVVARWNYRTATPVDADVTYNSCAQPFYDDGCYMSESPNDLSMNNMQLHTQAVWRTPQVVDNWVGFWGTSEHHMADLYCSKNFGFGCDTNASKTGYARVQNDFGINLGAVIPVPIASLTFSPNPVTAGQNVTGTVKLQSPAQVDTPVQLESNSQNATVLPSVTVKQGQTTATFQVETNANNLAPEASTVATITAFYAQDFQTQLTVRAP